MLTEELVAISLVKIPVYLYFRIIVHYQPPASGSVIEQPSFYIPDALSVSNDGSLWLFWNSRIYPEIQETS